MTTFHIDVDGKLLRATSDPDAVIPGTVTKTDIAPESGKQIWDGTGWGPLPPGRPPLPDAASPRDIIGRLRELGLDI